MENHFSTLVTPDGRLLFKEPSVEKLAPPAQKDLDDVFAWAHKIDVGVLQQRYGLENFASLWTTENHDDISRLKGLLQIKEGEHGQPTGTNYLQIHIFDAAGNPLAYLDCTEEGLLRWEGKWEGEGITTDATALKSLLGELVKNQTPPPFEPNFLEAQKALQNQVRYWLEYRGASDLVVVQECQKLGFEAESIWKMINYVREYPMVGGRITEAASSGEEGDGMYDMLVGGAWALGGIVVTVVSYSAVSQSGGSYVVAWGAVLYGGVKFLQGLMKASRG